MAQVVAGAVVALWGGLGAADYRGIATRFAFSDVNREMRPWPLPPLSRLVIRLIGAWLAVIGIVIMIAGIMGAGQR